MALLSAIYRVAASRKIHDFALRKAQSDRLLALTYLFFLSAFVCFFFPAELATTELGRFWLLGMSGFWLARALIQPTFFGLRQALSLTLFCVFLLGAIIHGIAWAVARGI